VFGGSWIGKNCVDFAGDQGRPIAGIVDANCEWFVLCPHGHIKYRLIFTSLFPTPCASYQCNSTARTEPFGSLLGLLELLNCFGDGRQKINSKSLSDINFGSLLPKLPVSLRFALREKAPLASVPQTG